MSRPQDIIPYDQLPEGFAHRVKHPPDPPPPPRPSATVALLRDGVGGPEVLLLRRSRRAGFVPGAYVFPGGGVDAGDASEPLVRKVQGVTPGAAEQRLNLPGGDPPALAYYIGALRETFEETGILVGRKEDGAFPPSAAEASEVEYLRRRLLAGEESFAQLLDRMGCRMAGGGMEYIGHWITPEAEPRRYDTRFFGAMVPEGARAVVDPQEMSDAVWLPPERALARSREGSLPMIFPTLRTLEELQGFSSAGAALRAFQDRPIPTRRPRLVRTEEGVGTVLPEEEG